MPTDRRRSKKISIPRARTSDRDVQLVLDAIKELLDRWNGSKGPELDQVVTFRDLTEGSIITYQGGRVYPARAGGSDATTIGFSNPDAGSRPPRSPRDLEAFGGLGAIFLNWTVDTEDEVRLYERSEVWRSAENDLTTASLQAVQTIPGYVDYTGDSSAFYYWVRAVGPAGASAFHPVEDGVFAETGKDPEYMLQVLENSLTESQLFKSLRTRIDHIDDPNIGLAARLQDLYEYIETDLGGAIIEQAEIDDQLAARHQSLAVKTETSFAIVRETQEARANEVESLARQVTELGARFNTSEDGGSANIGFILDERQARADAISAEAFQRQLLSARVDAVEGGDPDTLALILDERQVRADSDSAIASDVTTLTTRVGDNETSISTQVSSINGLVAQYSVKIDNNGAIAGFGLASELNDETGESFSEFIINANRFAIVDPTNPSPAYGEEFVPFAVENGVTYIKSAFIKDAAITSAKIETAAINSAHIDTAAINSVHIQDGSIETAQIGDTIQSVPFVSGIGGQGWQLKKNGDAEFHGTIYAENLTGDVAYKIVDPGKYMNDEAGANDENKEWSDVTDFSSRRVAYDHAWQYWLTVYSAEIPYSPRTRYVEAATPFFSAGVTLDYNFVPNGASADIPITIRSRVIIVDYLMPDASFFFKEQNGGWLTNIFSPNYAFTNVVIPQGHTGQGAKVEAGIALPTFQRVIPPGGPYTLIYQIMVDDDGVKDPDSGNYAQKGKVAQDPNFSGGAVAVGFGTRRGPSIDIIQYSDEVSVGWRTTTNSFWPNQNSDTFLYPYDLSLYTCNIREGVAGSDGFNCN